MWVQMYVLLFTFHNNDSRPRQFVEIYYYSIIAGVDEIKKKNETY